MKLLRMWVVVIPAAMLVLLLIGLVLTQGAMEQLGFLRPGVGAATGLVDQRPYQTAETLAGTAVSAEEQAFAQQAERLADHEVDQAFAMALREAGMQQRVPAGEAAVLARRIEALKVMVKEDQSRVDALEAQSKGSGVQEAAGDDLDVARAQLRLDGDELADATEDLARKTGDRRGEIQRELNAREAAMKKIEEPGKDNPREVRETALTGARRYGTLLEQMRAWVAERKQAALIAEAAQRARQDAQKFAKRHAEMERSVADAEGTGTAPVVPGVSPPDTAAVPTGSARVTMLNAMAGMRVVMSILDDRAETEQQLAAVYTQWEKQVWVQHRIIAHLLMESLAWVCSIVLAAVLAGTLGKMVLARVAPDARRARTLETILMLAVELVGAVAVLLVIFGLPSQTPTILGLATAGLTVVFQDFILAFFGWFVLMGKNGIRVSDWVEIDTVAGEVTDIGVFRTSLLETGNWTSRGHPTGRRVTFTNSFAIRGRYFNFSTHGQWMWDEIKLNVPATVNAYEVVKRMQTAVEAETAKNSEEAEREWKLGSRQNGLSRFTAQPTVDLRPTDAAGVDVIVRFVTRANERFDLRNRIYVAMLGLMEGTERPALEETPPVQDQGSAGA